MSSRSRARRPEHQVGVAARADQRVGAQEAVGAEVFAGGGELVLVARPLGGGQSAPGRIDLEERVLDEVAMGHEWRSTTAGTVTLPRRGMPADDRKKRTSAVAKIIRTAAVVPSLTLARSPWRWRRRRCGSGTTRGPRGPAIVFVPGPAGEDQAPDDQPDRRQRGHGDRLRERDPGRPHPRADIARHERGIAHLVLSI